MLCGYRAFQDNTFTYESDDSNHTSWIDVSSPVSSSIDFVSRDWHTTTSDDIHKNIDCVGSLLHAVLTSVLHCCVSSLSTS